MAVLNVCYTSVDYDVREQHETAVTAGKSLSLRDWKSPSDIGGTVGAP